MANKIAFILTAKNLHDTQRVGVNYYKDINLEASFELDLEDTKVGLDVLEEKVPELTGFNPKLEDITFHGTYLKDLNKKDKVYIYSIAVNKIKEDALKDEFEAKDNTAVRWLTAQSAAELSDWRVPLTIMKIITGKTAQIIVEPEEEIV